jgi:hypothetical protein
VKLAPFHLSYDELTIPPQSDSRFSGGCADIAGEFTQLGETFAMQLYYLLPHTHALGTRMFVEVLGGPNDGDTLVDVTGFNGEARGLAFDPPIALDGAQGLRFGCEFHNPRNEMVVWGFDDQEMCETLGFAASPALLALPLGLRRVRRGLPTMSHTPPPPDVLWGHCAGGRRVDSNSGPTPFGVA